MQKRFWCFLMALCMVVALLPAAAGAVWEVAPRRLDVSIEAPVEGQKPATTGTSNYAAGTQSTVTRVVWSGELDANGCFKAGVAYTVTVTERINADLAGVFCLQSDDPRINYEKAAFVSLSADSMEATASYTFPPLQSNAEKEAEEAKRAEEDAKLHAEHEEQQKAKDEANWPLYRKQYYTKAQADAAWWELNRQELILDASMGHDWSSRPDNADWVFDSLDADQLSKITRVLMDYPDPTPMYLVASWVDSYGSCLHNVQEVWLGPKVDAKKFISNLEEEINRWDTSHSSGYLNGKLTIFVPDGQMPNGLLDYASDGISPAYSVKVYSGDAYEAYKQGASAGRDWCPGHEYTGRIRTASRMVQNITCRRPNLWYYSCKWCGKCEYDPSHTFSLDEHGNDTSKRVWGSHEYGVYDLSDKNYLGTNEKGEKVYLLSCIWCGINKREYDLSYTYAQFLEERGSAAKDNAEFKQSYQDLMDLYKKEWAVGGDMYNLLMERPDGTAFSVASGKDVTARVSTWAQDGVNWASQNGLIDAALLGSDYTGSITRLQFCSVAVRMAEKMTGKAITPAPSGTFTDTDSEYARKAYAAGITGGVGDGKFDPAGTLNRQQMAAFIYRALMYVKDNSDIRYTIYDSRLSSYTDADQLAGWAAEPMAFMNALGLITGTSDATLSPNANCTIEQALVVANRSLQADLIGWYQSLGGTERNITAYGHTVTGGSLDKRCFFSIPTDSDVSADAAFNQLRYRQSERFWVTGTTERPDRTWTMGSYISRLKMIDPYTGDTLYIQACDFRPIKAD